MTKPLDHRVAVLRDDITALCERAEKMEREIPSGTSDWIYLLDIISGLTQTISAADDGHTVHESVLSHQRDQ